MTAEKKKPIKLKKIPLDTFYCYHADEDGNIYCKGRKINPWRHVSKKPYPKDYFRVRLKMKDKKWKLFFVHRLMGFTWFKLPVDSKQLVLHNSSIGTDNRRVNLKIGDTLENQGADRLTHGTYWNRWNHKKNQQKQAV